MFQFYFLDITRGSFFDITPSASACSIKIWVQKNTFTLWNLFELNTLKGTKGTWKVSTMLAHAWALSLLANISYLIRSLTKMPKPIELVRCWVVKKIHMLQCCQSQPYLLISNLSIRAQQCFDQWAQGYI